MRQETTESILENLFNPISLFGIPAILMMSLSLLCSHVSPPTDTQKCVAVIDRIEVERINLRDYVIGGAIVHQTGVTEADRAFNRLYARWFPDKWRILSRHEQTDR